MSNTFDRQRFVNTIKLDIATNWRRFSKLFFAAMAGLSGLFLVFTINARNVGSADEFGDMIWGMVAMSYVVLGILLCMSGCYLFNNMKTKQSRITFLALPSSNLEKFLSRYLMTTVGMVITALAALLAADVLRMLFGWIIGVHYWDSVFLKFLGCLWMLPQTIGSEPTVVVNGMAQSLFAYRWLWLVLFLSWMLVSHAEFMLGGTVFRRHAMLLTILSMMILSSIHFLLWPFHTSWVDLMFVGMDRKPGFDGGMPVGLFLTVAVNLAITAFCYWASFKLFCRSQVISRKWTNL